MLTLQSFHVVIDCPICARPLEMKRELVSHEVTCGHCRGEFAVYETDEGSLAAVSPSGADSLQRAEQLLRATCDTNLSVPERDCQQRFPVVSAGGNETHREGSPSTSPKDAECEQEPQPTILLVEHRDEVFARLATDMAERGMLVVRAKSATEALKLVDQYEPILLVGNVDLPDQSGWLMTAKLRLFNCRLCVWLYQRHSSSYYQGMAQFLDIDTILSYQGDLLGLSEAVGDRLDFFQNQFLSEESCMTPKILCQNANPIFLPASNER